MLSLVPKLKNKLSKIIESEKARKRNADEYYLKDCKQE